MKKMSSLLLVFFMGTVLAHAQQRQLVHPQKDQQQFKGYTIHLLPAMGGTYGYDIVKEKQVVLHQMRNPFSGAPVGLKSKEDAYKVARWQIENLKQSSTPPARAQKQIPGWEKLPPVLQQRLNPKAQQTSPVIFPRPTTKQAAELGIKINH